MERTQKTLEYYTDVTYNIPMEPVLHLLEAPLSVVGFRQIQISGPACASLTVVILRGILNVDRRPAAWVLRDSSVPYPPDLREAGIQLERLLSLFVESGGHADRAADTVLRSGQFSCLVYELPEGVPPEPGVVSRFMHLCRHNHTTMVLIARDREYPTMATAAFHIDTDTRYTSDRQLIRITVRRSRIPLADCEVPAYGPDYLY